MSLLLCVHACTSTRMENNAQAVIDIWRLLCVCVYTHTHTSSPKDMFIDFREAGGEREKHQSVAPHIHPDQTHNLLVYGMMLQSTEPPSWSPNIFWMMWNTIMDRHTCKGVAFNLYMLCNQAIYDLLFSLDNAPRMAACFSLIFVASSHVSIFFLF